MFRPHREKSNKHSLIENQHTLYTQCVAARADRLEVDQQSAPFVIYSVDSTGNIGARTASRFRSQSSKNNK